MIHKTRTKALSWLLSLALMLSLMPGLGGTAQAAGSGACGDNLSWTLENNTLTISGSGAMADYESISAEPWYNDRNGINAVVIESGVTSIGNGAFNACTNLASVTISNTVTSIGNNAFCSCRNLTSVTIPSTVTSIGSDAFKGCSELTSVEIPNSVTSIGGSAFADCGNLTSIEIPNGVTKIGDYTFQWCYKLSTVTFACATANQTLTVGTDAFKDVRATAAYSASTTALYDGDTAIEAGASLTSLAGKTLTWKARPSHTHNDITFTAWTSADSLPTTAGSYYLTKDVTISSKWTVPTGETNLCLNGHKIDANGGAYNVLYVSTGATLNLYDEDGNSGKITGSSGNSSGYGGGVMVSGGGVFNMHGGTVTGNSAMMGGGVYIHNDNENNTFTMSGGVITGNTAQYGGGGVEVGGGKFNLSGSPTITGNTGGNVYLPNGKTVTVGALTEGARIGVTMASPGVFTSSTGDAKAKDYAAKFTSDVDAYQVLVEGDELKLATPVTEYPLWVGGTQVTSANAADVFSDGKVSYTPAVTGENPTPATLTLNNYSYSGSGYKENNYPDSPFSAIYYTGTEPLTIQLSGANSITRTGSSSASSVCGIKTTNCADLTITGSSTDSLNVTCEGSGSSAIYLIGSNTTLTVQNVNLTTATTADSGNPSISCRLVKVVQGASVTATGGYYGISASAGVEISENSTVIAAGNNKAINGPVKNAVPGTGWTNKEGTAGQANIAVSTEGQVLSDYKKVQFPAAHTHSFTYSASGATITATCSADGCPLTNKKATLTIVAPTLKTVGGEGSEDATITDESGIRGDAPVRYYAATKSGAAYTKKGVALESAPTAAGDYVAEITLGTATASVGYTIKAVGGTATAVTAADIVQILSNSVEIKGKAGQEYIIVPKDTTPDWSDPTKVQFVYGEGHNEITFHDLTPITEYDIYTRVAETETATAGPAAAKTTVMTCLEEMGVTSNDGLTGLVGATYTVTTTPAATGENGLTFRWYHYAGPIDFGATPDSITEIAGATGSAYTLPESDVGKYFGVKAFKNGKEVGAIWLDQPVRYGTVTYDAKGGTPTPDSVSNLKFGDKLTKPDDPTRSGYNFAGWYMEEDCKTAWTFATDIVDVPEITLYARWSAAPLHTITGIVKDSTDNTQQENVTVTLARGDTMLGKAVTNNAGEFTFTGVESGTYNIIATKDSQTKTELVELTENRALEIKLPETGKNSVLDNDNAGDFAATVGGLDEIAADETVSAGETVTITLSVTGENFINELTSEEQTAFTNGKTAIDALPETNGKTIEYLNLKLEKTVATTGTTTKTDIGDTNNKLLTIIIPYAASGKQNVTVYRYHGTTAAAMTQDPAPNAEGFVVGTDSITLYAKGFSTYAIGYTSPTPTPTPSYPSSGGNGGYSPSTTTITVPVSGDSASVSVSASVSNTTATVKAPTTAQLDKVIGESVKTGEVTIDVSGLNRNIATVSIPAETVKAIEKAVSDPDNDASALTVKLTDGSVTFDAKALAAIVDQAKGSTIQLNLDNIGESKLKTAQKTAIRDLDVQAVYDAYMTSNGQRISDFKGGKAAVTVSYTLKDGQIGRGVVVWYVADDGKTAEVPTAYNDKTVSFTVEHFSNYVIAYDAQRAAVCPKDDTCPISAFSDADPTTWYHDGVHYVLENGIMSGYGNGLFGPGNTTSRAMMAQILFNIEGGQSVSDALKYSDVNGADWYAEAIRWASTENIMDGYGNGVFGPNDAMTREQLVTIMYRYAKKKGIDVSMGEDTNILSYDDAFDVSEWAIPAMQWAVGSGLISGRTASTLNPQDKATRAEIATIIMRYCEEIAK